MDAARIVGGGALALAVTLAGAIGAVGTFGTLMLSLHALAAGDGRRRLPAARRHATSAPNQARRGSPSSSAPCFWAICYPLGFERSLILDVLLTGLSILLEFWALVALRIREPNLARPYRVPGGIVGAIAIGLPPLALMIAALVRNQSELLGDTNELVIGAAIVAAGVAAYFLSSLLHQKKSALGFVEAPSRRARRTCLSRPPSLIVAARHACRLACRQSSGAVALVTPSVVARLVCFRSWLVLSGRTLRVATLSAAARGSRAFAFVIVSRSTLSAKPVLPTVAP